MPLQNRVDPHGLLHAVEARGAWMGNRGILHDDSRRVVAAWRSRRWIACVLQFRGRHREVFAPRRYSELFFLDEATSLAAGHRPCAECRRRRFEEFRDAWERGRGVAPRGLRADEIDRVLHTERVRADRGKKTYRASLSSLPAGTMVELGGVPHLIWGGRARPWTFGGYGAPAEVSFVPEAEVLTPRSIVAAIGAGFVPQVHESAGGQAGHERQVVRMDAPESELREVVEAVTPRLLALSEAQSLQSPAPGKWCPKEVLGHLVDSASNNHQRFVRAQFTDELVFEGYSQEAWVETQRYRSEPWTDLVGLWRLFNLHLSRVIEATPAHVRTRKRARHNLDEIAWQTVPRDRPATLEYFMRDYVAHLKHHLAQILGPGLAGGETDARIAAPSRSPGAAERSGDV